jgi:uncharacterized caspase-like protein
MGETYDPPQASERKVSALPLERKYAVQPNRWAIIVGISKYRDERLNLSYAHRDAQALYHLLQTPAGGGFEAERVVKLVDEEATTAAITRALRSFLKKPAREDVVLLYFACHGAPDVDRPNIVYLISHDTDPDDISGTALPMREIDLSLQENLLAEKVVIVADTCHSGSIGYAAGRRGSGNDAEAINAYLERVSQAHGGVALLTSAESSETAREGKQWGGGHGVFTHFLLRGLQGEADGYGRPKDGVVSVGELFDYVRDSVKRATDDQQHPAIGSGPFDRNLPMAITGGADAREHYELGRRLYELGWRLDEQERFLAAAAQFDEAIRLSKMAKATLPEAVLGVGQALLATGDAAGCVRALETLPTERPSRPLPDALLYLGLARAKLNDPKAARDAFEQFIAASPSHDCAGWAQQYLQRAPGRKLALLIGINEYQLPRMGLLRGCINDVRLMRQALVARGGFHEDGIVAIVNAGATKHAIERAFETLAERADPTDLVVVHFSGMSRPDGLAERTEPTDTAASIKGAYLIVHDTLDARSGVSAAELHSWLQAIPSLHKTVVLDTRVSRAFNELAADSGDYRVLLASDSKETSVELDGQVVPCGLFTSILSMQLAQADPEALTFGDLVDHIRRIAERDVRQAPVLIGDREDLVFAVPEVHQWAFKFALRRTYPRETAERLRARRRHLPSGLLDAFPALDVSFARAFIEHSAFDDAIEVLEQVAPRPGPHRAEALRLLATAQLASHRLQAASSTLGELALLISEPALRTALAKQGPLLARPRRFALLVGINRYQHPDFGAANGAVNDVRLLQEALVTSCGFATEDIVALLDGQATRANIIDNFHRLADIGRTDPALFYFAGNGSMDADGSPTLVSTDGRTGEVYDIRIEELVAIAHGSSNLVSMIDASFIRYDEDQVAGGRSVSSDRRERPAVRDILFPDALRRRRDANQFHIGWLTVYDAEAIYMSSVTVPPRIMAGKQPGLLRRKPEVHGYLTYALVQALASADASSLSYRSWLEAANAGQGSSRPLFGAMDHLNEPRLDEPLFENHSLKESIHSLLQRIDREPVEEAVAILRRVIDERHQQGDWYPEGRLNLGIACAAAGDHAHSIEMLERTISLYRDPVPMDREKERDPRAQDHLREAHYQLGRVLFESGKDFTRAVSELDKAVIEGGDARAFYYLGQAIRQMVERETLTKAEEALKTYLAMGAPLGRENDVREFLGSRRETSPGAD